MKPKYYVAMVTDEELAALPDAQRNPLVMWMKDAMPYEKIAAELGRPIGTVKSRIYRARKKIIENRADKNAATNAAIEAANTQALAGLATFNKAFAEHFPKKD